MFAIFFSIYVIILAISILLGYFNKFKDNAIWLFIALPLVSMVFFSYETYFTVFVTPITTIQKWLMSEIILKTTGLSTVGSVFELFDDSMRDAYLNVFNIINDFDGFKYDKCTGWGFECYINTFFRSLWSLIQASFSMILLLFALVGLYISIARVVIQGLLYLWITLALGGIFGLFLFFKSTTSMFNLWLRNVSVYVLFRVVLKIVIVVIVKLLEMFFNDIKYSLIVAITTMLLKSVVDEIPSFVNGLFSGMGGATGGVSFPTSPISAMKKTFTKETSSSSSSGPMAWIIRR